MCMTHHFAENTVDSTTTFTSVNILSSQKESVNNSPRRLPDKINLSLQNTYES